MQEVSENLDSVQLEVTSTYDKKLWLIALLSFFIGFFLMPIVFMLLLSKYGKLAKVLLNTGPLAATLLLVIAGWKYSGSFSKLLKKLQVSAVPLWFLVTALPISLTITVSGGFLTMYWQKFAKHMGWVFDMPATEALARNGNSIEVTILVVSALLLAPFYEEILFRKALFEFVRWRCGVIIAFIVAPFVFALVHASLLQLPGLFFMALIWQGVYLWTRNLSVTMILHLCNNLFAIAVLLIARYAG